MVRPLDGLYTVIVVIPQFLFFVFRFMNPRWQRLKLRRCVKQNVKTGKEACSMYRLKQTGVRGTGENQPVYQYANLITSGYFITNKYKISLNLCPNSNDNLTTYKI